MGIMATVSKLKNGNLMVSRDGSNLCLTVGEWEDVFSKMASSHDVRLETIETKRLRALVQYWRSYVTEKRKYNDEQTEKDPRAHQSGSKGS